MAVVVYAVVFVKLMDIQLSFLDQVEIRYHYPSHRAHQT